MKSLTVVLVTAAVAGCAWDEPAYAPIAAPQIASKPDPAAAIVMQCDRMGLRSPEAHRLCVLRGVDRLATTPGPTTGYAPIQILPYPYPPLAPQGSTITVVPGFR